MAYTISDDGRYHVPINALAERLQNQFNLDIRELAPFDPVDDVHVDGSLHYKGNAMDIQDWRPDEIDGVNWKTRTGNLGRLLTGSGAEIIGPHNDAGGAHDTHLHAGSVDGIFRLDPQQYDYLYGGNSGGQNATFAFTRNPSTASPIADQTVAPATKSYDQMSASEINSAYDKMRMAGDVFKAQEEGMKMHKAHFNKR